MLLAIKCLQDLIVRTIFPEKKYEISILKIYHPIDEEKKVKHKTHFNNDYKIWLNIERFFIALYAYVKRHNLVTLHYSERHF